jgi:hypothetical protein
MGCCGSPTYQAPAAPNLSNLYNQAVSSNLQSAPQYAQAGSQLYGEYAPQYVGANQSILNNLTGMTPQQSALADQSVLAGQAQRGNINGDANIAGEVMGRQDYQNQLLNQKLGQLGAVGAAGGNQATQNNFLNPNSGPVGQQAGLSLYQGQTQNAQNAFTDANANNPFTMALNALGSVAKVAGPAMALGI